MIYNHNYKHISVLINGVEYGIKDSFLSVKIEEIEDDNRTYIVVNVHQYFGDLSSLVLDFEKNSFEMSVEKTVVDADELIDEDLEITLEELGGEESGYSIGDVVEIDVTDDVLSND